MFGLKKPLCRVYDMDTDFVNEYFESIYVFYYKNRVEYDHEISDLSRLEYLVYVNWIILHK